MAMADLQANEHRASVLCAVAPWRALEFLADGLQLGHWALGCWNTEPDGAGVVRGHSLFDGAPSWVRPVADRERMTVVYHVGAAPHALQPRIHAEVAPVEGAGCRITLHATRTAAMDDARWARLVHCHEVEVLLIQGQLARLP